MRTFTITANMAMPAKSVHAGPTTVLLFKESTGTPFRFGSASRGDVIQMAKIPNGAWLTDLDGTCGIGSTTFHYLIRLAYTEGNGSPTVVTISPSITSGQTRMSLIRPFKVSISDDQAVQHAVLILQATTGATASISFSLSLYGKVEYLMDVPSQAG